MFFQFNPNLTTLSRNTIQDNVNTTITNYFIESTGKFGQSFRRSNLLTLIDDVSPAILSSRATVKMQRRFSPTLTKIQDHTLRFAASIAEFDDKNYIITSNAFTYKNKVCIVRNKLNSNKLEVFNQNDRIVIVDNVGSFSTDTVSIVGLQIDNFSGAESFIKVTAVAANQSAITPFREDIIEHDKSQSFSRIVDVDTGVTN